MQIVQTTKEKVAHQSANFFTAALEPFIRKLAVEIGYLPASHGIMSDNEYEGSKPVSGSDGSLRSTRTLESIQLNKYDALFDKRHVFNAIREAFLLHGGDDMTPQHVPHTIAILLQSSEPLPLQAELFRETLSSWVQAATVDETPPLAFFTVAWRADFQTIQSHSYFFSELTNWL